MDEAINWHDLEIFHAVLEQGSFSGAARALGLSQPTVSRHIEALERSLGKELFARTGTGLEPSELALALGEHAARMNDGMYGIQRVLDGKEEAPRGVVTISLPHGFGGIPLALSLVGFHDHYPDIAIDLKSLSEFGVEPERFPIRCSGNTMLVQVLGNTGVTLGSVPIGLHLPTMRRVLPEFH